MSTDSSDGASRLVLVLAACCALLAPATTAAQAPLVLVIYSNNRLLPANVEADQGLREAIPHSVEQRAEFLDAPRFVGDAYLAATTLFLKEKYAARPPAVVVAAGAEALRFVLTRRGELFPGVPVVHMGVPKFYLPSLPPLPSDVVGVAFEYAFSATIDQALRWHPQARRLVLITGRSPLDREFEARLREVVTDFQGRVTAEFLAGLPTAAVLKRLGELGAESVIFTPGYFQDGNGQDFLPREAAREMAAVATAPIYAPFDTFVGTGVVGGYTATFTAMGRQAGRAVSALLAGTAPAALRLPEVMPSTLILDWRQVRRWGIDPDAIPHDADIRFKTPTFLEEHPRQAIIAAVVFLVQSGLIGWLLVERRRRRLAELSTQKQRYELFHASRRAIAGELTSSIAHEINQPLGAILSNADAADLMLASGADRREALRAILADIRRDDLRASEVIRRLRALLAKQEDERQPLDLNGAMRDVTAILGGDARRRGMTLDIQPAATAATVVGDRVQIQQVLINLLLNAMDAMADMPEDRRTVNLSVETDAGGVAFAVRDRGRGIAPEHLPQLFDSFFTTKQKGMGLGLSITRTIVEAHGGRIWAENAPGRGAVFHVTFPAARGAHIQSQGAP